MAVAMISVTLSLDTSELRRDMERFENGELELPTVSAMRTMMDGKVLEEIPVYLDEESCGC